MNTEQEIRELKEKVARLEKTLETLIAWSRHELGAVAMNELLTMLYPPTVAQSALLESP